jgi:chromosome segregation ATPase
VDEEYWRGYGAAKLQGAAAENELRQKLEQAEAERDEARSSAEKREGHLQAALKRRRTRRERARQAEAENARLKAALEQAHRVIEQCNGLIDCDEHPALSAEIAAILAPCDETGQCPTVPAALRGEGREGAR